MTRAVWKFPLRIRNTFDLELPKGAQLLHVDVQGDDDVMLWALVDLAAEKETRHFLLAGTGHEIVDEPGIDLRFVGTFLWKGGRLVFHLFEMRPAQ